MSNSTVALPNRHYFYNGKSTVHLFVMFTNKNFITSTFYFRWWHNPACFTFKLMYKNYYTEHFWWAFPMQSRQNCTFSGKLCTILKVLFLAMVSYFPLAKKSFSCVCIDPHLTPTYIFHYFVCLGFDSGKHDGKPYPQLKISIHVHKLSSKQFSVEYQNISTLY